jgi:predicted alpha/beta superfamily hydrolase
LPDNYVHSEENYPVLYFTDGNWNISRFHGIIGHIGVSPVIAVGIGYPDNSDEIGVLGLEDFTTPSPKYQKFVKDTFDLDFPSGGADHFISFIQNDLFQFINARYRTKVEDRILRLT